jgi:hypothetical protein
MGRGFRCWKKLGDFLRVFYGLDSMLWTVHSGNTANEDCLVLARVQMPPSTLLGMIVASKLFLALRAAELCTRWVLDPHLDLFGWNVQFDTRNGPRGGESYDMLIELFVLHSWGFLSPAIVPSTKEMPDGPKFQSVDVGVGSPDSEPSETRTYGF